MEPTQKPFVCKSPGCTQSFTNEDHLTVHLKKHTMSLHLGHDSKAASFVADQTPTPTRLIRNLDEIGLFDGIIVNPFDETFRRAVEAKTTCTVSKHPEVATGASTPAQTVGSCAQATTLCDDASSSTTAMAAADAGKCCAAQNENETLNTPHVLPYHDVTAADCRYVASPMDNAQRTLCETVEKWRSAVAQSTASSASEKPTSPTHGESQTQQQTSSMSRPRFVRRVSREPAQAHHHHQQATAARTPNAADRLRASGADASAIPLKMPKLVKLSSPLIAGQPAQPQPICEAAELDRQQLVPKLTPIVTPPEPLPPPSQVLVDLTAETVREKLKRQIVQKAQHVASAGGGGGDGQTRAASLEEPKTGSSEENRSPPTAAAAANDSRLGGGGSIGERNRAAAQRYRSKMKEWKVQLTQSNARLEAENRTLRAQVERLNALLSAHQQCSVTKAMAEGNCIPVGPPKMMIKPASSTNKRLIRPHRPTTTHPTSRPVAVPTTANNGADDITTNPMYILVNQHKPPKCPS